MIRIEAPHFCAGVLLRAGVVYRAAPIIRYMIGWPQGRVMQFCKRKCWSYARTGVV